MLISIERGITRLTDAHEKIPVVSAQSNSIEVIANEKKHD